MDDVGSIVLVLIVWFVLCGVGATIAASKGRDRAGYFLLGVFLSPLVGILLALVAKPNVPAVEKQKIASGTEKKCPFCAEMIKVDAIVCRYCGRDLPQAVTTSSSGQRFGGVREVWNEQAPSVHPAEAVVAADSFGGVLAPAPRIDPALARAVAADPLPPVVRAEGSPVPPRPTFSSKAEYDAWKASKLRR